MIAALLALMLATGAPTVSNYEYNRVQPGMSRHRVQRIFDTTGHRRLMYADEHQRHLIKTYHANNGDTVVIEYVGPLESRTGGPLAGPYHLKVKTRHG